MILRVYSKNRPNSLYLPSAHTTPDHTDRPLTQFAGSGGGNSRTAGISPQESSRTTKGKWVTSRFGEGEQFLLPVTHNCVFLLVTIQFGRRESHGTKQMSHTFLPTPDSCLPASPRHDNNNKQDMGHDTAEPPAPTVPCSPEMPIGSSPDSRTAPHLPEMVPPISIPAPTLISAQPTPLPNPPLKLKKATRAARIQSLPPHL